MNRFFVLLLLLCSSLARMSGQGSFTATWNFDNSTPEVSSITGNGAPNLNGQDAVFGPGVGEPQNGGRYPTGNPGIAYSGDTWTTSNSPDASDYLQFCVDTDLGTVFNPGASVGIRFDERRSGDGPRAVEVRASTDGFGTFTSLGSRTIPDNTSWRSQAAFPFTIPASPVVKEVCFRIYGYNSKNDINPNSGTWRFDNVQISGPSALPVTWLSFEARAEGNAVALDWATATETQNAHFAVERSADGARFTEIGRVPGAGNSAAVQTYAFRDEKPLSGLNYYRLRQVDADGRYAFSRTVAVHTGPNPPVLSLFPNPATDYLTVQLTQADEPPLQWLLIDAAGRVLRAGTADTERFDVAVGDLAQGLYGLQVVTTQWSITQLFIRK